MIEENSILGSENLSRVYGYHNWFNFNLKNFDPFKSILKKISKVNNSNNSIFLLKGNMLIEGMIRSEF